jgi:hypothetical protein
MALGTPSIGTGSIPSWFSEYETVIDNLLIRLSDNTSNQIEAKDVRDSVWTLYNQIQIVASQSLTQSMVLYTSATPSTATIGGIIEGSTFSNEPLQNLFDLLLHPYVSPAIEQFVPSQTEFQFGQIVPTSFSYSINVGSSPLDGGFGLVITAPGFSQTKIVNGTDPEIGTTNNYNPTFSLSPSIIEFNIGTISFQTQDLLTFSGTTSLVFKHKRYYGQLTIPGGFDFSSPLSVASVSSYLTDSLIRGLSYSELSTNVNFSQIVDFNNQYFIFAAPTIFGFNYPIGFYFDNIFTQDYTKIRSNSTFINDFGYSTPYDIYITNYPIGDPALVSTIPVPQGYLDNNFTNVIPSVIVGDQGPTGSVGATGPTGPGLTLSYLKLGELDYTELNDLSYGFDDTISLTSSNVVPENSRIVGLYARTNQPFISPSGSITEFAFYDAPGGTDILNTFSWLNPSNAFSIMEPLTPSGGNPAVALFLTQSYVYGSVISFISTTQSTTYSIFCTFTDGTSSVGVNYISNPQNWISGNVSFVIEYQTLDLNTLPF